MADPKTASSDPVLKRAELPPGIDVPSPEMSRRSSPANGDRHADAGRLEGKGADAVLSPEILREIRGLADRVGGIDRLRDIVTTLAGLAH